MTRARKYNAILQVSVGLFGIAMHTVQLMQGQPLDISHVLCFFGIALGGGQTLSAATIVKGVTHV